MINSIKSNPIRTLWGICPTRTAIRDWWRGAD